MTRAFILPACALLLLLACDEAPASIASDFATVEVTQKPFSVRVLSAEGEELLALADGGGAYAGLTGTRDLFFEEPQLLPGWDGYTEGKTRWRAPRTVTHVITKDPRTLEVRLDGEDTTGTLVFRIDGARVRIEAALTPKASADPIDKLALAFSLADDDAFFGLGERFGPINHRGLSLYQWAEEGGLGQGEGTPPSAKAGEENPFPNGPSMTYFPVPFFLSSRGFGVYLDTTRRTELHLGSEQKDAWRVAINHAALGITVYAHPDPLEVLALYTEDTGRPPVPAPWVFGPRRRVSPNQQHDGQDELELLRALDVPTTGVDDAVHLLPHRSELGREQELSAWTSRAHALGYKVMAYNNPYVSMSESSAAEDFAYGAEHGLFLRDERGEIAETFFISGVGQTLATIDLTNPETVAWFQSLLKRSLALGYDGWMHDFGEYTGRTWTAHDGSTGAELHNRFPVLSAQAAYELLERERPHDYLFFVRSGYAGSQRYVPAVWGGDAEATFDETQGIPSALRSGVSLSMSGLPYWGSDTSGFKCLTDYPRDKDMYLRWAELSALSPIFMEQNACSDPVGGGGATKWTLYADEETTRVYAEMARLHTRLLPYFLLLAHEAHETGAPLMRHPYLVHPKDPGARTVEDGFFLGDRIYALPVIGRAQTVRTGWLPPGRWLDVTEERALDGGGEVTVDAPLTKLPWFLKEGALLPLLDTRTDTLAPVDHEGGTRDDVVSWHDVKHIVHALVFLGQQPRATLTLTDGVTLTVERTSEENTPLSRVDEVAMARCTGCTRTQEQNGLVRTDVAIALAESSRVVVDGLAFSHAGGARSVRFTVWR
jgi:sulfoquinovosidase